MQPAVDLDRAVDSVIAALSPGVDLDWHGSAGTLEWSCRFTAEHAAHCLQAYAIQLASRAPTHYVSFFSRALEDATNAQVLELLEASGRLLSSVVRAAKPTDRGFHPFGMADAEGTAGMGGIEVLVHGGDIATGLGLPFEPPPDVCTWILARMFPDRYAENASLGSSDIDPWTTIQWATGRISLPELPDVGTNWRWHSTPPTANRRRT
ncbi:hypothetical protein EV643_13659 [Kribbella sp. VKM Ac-2527]|uniref:Mycothiol maleylpyruvate isomerase-like protein n=1 Tax=Kribbella caucasensis TaxID=2512215 RepID=A0A4R6J6H5_9ACTN|nr:hypothetical protein [Kribbella sp. VKM Ac-2527]TDO30677.1 hypothetical protein EV643_13659 [Kribbella sp. VKM Ac-2527]